VAVSNFDLKIRFNSFFIKNKPTSQYNNSKPKKSQIKSRKNDQNLIKISYGISFKRNIFTNDKTIAAKRAVPNPEILKPVTILVINIRSNALITKVNNPKVKKLIGNVSKINIGLINIDNIPHTIDITTNVAKPPTTNPGTK